MQNLKKIFCSVLIIHFLNNNRIIDLIYADDAKNELNLQEITLPSEIKDIGKQSGSIYYSNSVKNKVLIPAHIWGEVSRPGLHFIPADTSLIKGLSMAGGPSGSAKLDEVILSRSNKDGTIKQYEFNISKGGDLDSYQFKIEPGDSIFIKKDNFFENRSYYTSLIGVAISILSTILILKKVK